VEFVERIRFSRGTGKEAHVRPLALCICYAVRLHAPCILGQKTLNDRIEERVNKVNASRGLATLKVGDPFTVDRHLRIE